MTIEKIDLYASFFNGLSRILGEYEEKLVRKKLNRSRFTSQELNCLGNAISKITRDTAVEVHQVIELLAPFIIKRREANLSFVEEELAEYLKKFCLFQITCFEFTPSDMLLVAKFVELEESAERFDELEFNDLIAIRSSSVCKHFMNRSCSLPNTT